MNKIRLISILCAFIGVIAFLYYSGLFAFISQPEVSSRDEVSPVVAPSPERSFASEKYGYSFSYPLSPQNYEVITTEPEFLIGELVEAVTLRPTPYDSDASEGPPTISVMVYKNPKLDSPLLWVKNNLPESGFDRQLKEAQTIWVAGTEGVRYLSDGLYPIDTVVVQNENMMYVLTGSYISPLDQMSTDFALVTESFSFR